MTSISVGNVVDLLRARFNQYDSERQGDHILFVTTSCYVFRSEDLDYLRDAFGACLGRYYFDTRNNSAYVRLNFWILYVEF